MGLNIYTSPIETSKIDTDEYIPVTFDGTTGGSIDLKLYVRNDDLELWFSDIQVTPYEDGTTLNVVIGPAWEIRVMEKDITPTTEEWLELSAGNSITLSSDIGSATKGDISTYLAFWMRITVPRDQQVQNIESIVVRLNATSGLVGE